MIRELRPLLTLLLDKRLKRVSLTIVRKRDGIHVEALAFTGNHTYACASYANVHRPDKKAKVTVADVLLTGSRRLENLFDMLRAQDLNRASNGRKGVIR